MKGRTEARWAAMFLWIWSFETVSINNAYGLENESIVSTNLVTGIFDLESDNESESKVNSVSEGQ